MAKIGTHSRAWAYEQTFFPSAQKIFPFSNPNPFPFEPKETKIREDNFSEMKEREESSSIFVVGERIYNVKFNMNAQTWLLNHYWLFLLEYFFSSQGGPWSKRLCRPYAYVSNPLNHLSLISACNEKKIQPSNHLKKDSHWPVSMAKAPNPLSFIHAQ